MTTYTVAPRTGHPTLLYSELDLDIDNLRADIAVLGMPYGAPYAASDFSNDQTNAPSAIRQATDRVVRRPGTTTSTSTARCCRGAPTSGSWTAVTSFPI